MRYSKSSVFAIALTVACSAAEFSSVANAQNIPQDFPWRSKTSAKTAVSSVTSAVRSSVKSALATPARDLTTSETIATPTPTYESMPSVIYDEGKKYVRRGDTYIESTDYSAAASVGETFNTAVSNSTQLPAAKKSSFFQKTKDLTDRLNPFSKSSRSETAYRSSDWKVPSFSQSLPSFSKKDSDPITFAPVTPLPARSSVPAALDSVPTALASTDTYQSPGLAVPARDSQFKSALPTETKLTSIFADKEESTSKSDFKPELSSVADVPRQAQLPSSVSRSSAFSPKVSKTSAKDVSPKRTSTAAKFVTSEKAKMPTVVPTKTEVAAEVVDVSKGFSFTQEDSPKAQVPTAMKSTSDVSVKSKIRTAAKKSATEISKKVSQDFSPAAEVKSEIRREVSKVKSKVVRPVRTAHELSAEHEFWSPRR